MKNELVILVDENDSQTGLMEKMESHKKAMLHRAVSVFVFNSKGEWLMQKRAAGKYHSGSLWTNTCCTHPFPGENNLDAANRRLMEEMGMQGDLQELFSFTYKESLDNELTEYEFDHVFISFSDSKPNINPEEVSDYKYINFTQLDKDIQANPWNYTVWFKKIYKQVQLNLLK